MWALWQTVYLIKWHSSEQQRSDTLHGVQISSVHHFFHCVDISLRSAEAALSSDRHFQPLSSISASSLRDVASVRLPSDVHRPIYCVSFSFPVLHLESHVSSPPDLLIHNLTPSLPVTQSSVTSSSSYQNSPRLCPLVKWLNWIYRHRLIEPLVNGASTVSADTVVMDYWSF